MKTLDCAGKLLDLSEPVVMGILNVTPDSFSDGGRFTLVDAAIDQAERMLEAGASIIDIGGESTRPGAQPVDADAECRRVIPVIEALNKRGLDIIISIDTSKPSVMQHAVESGAGMVNDVCALRAENAMQTVAALGVPVCLMHMQGEPRTMQADPSYDNVVEEVNAYLLGRAKDCVAAGIDESKILIDPGFGFGKKLEHNLSLLKHLDQFKEMAYPLLVGVSRKSMLGMITGKQTDQRLAASLAAAAVALQNGADILRVHDVDETVDVVKFFTAMRNAV